MTERKNIKVKAETFEELQEEKPDGVTWDYFQRQLLEAWRTSRN